MKYTLSAALLLGNTAWAIPQNVDVGNGHPTYKNPSASITARVNDLVGRMNITEKMAQLMQGILYINSSNRCPLDSSDNTND